jgi:magnesium transporter
MDVIELRPELQTFITDRNWEALGAVVSDWLAPDLADLLVSLDEPDRAKLFGALSRECAAEVLTHLDTDDRNALVVEFSDDEARRILADLAPDDRAELLSELPGFTKTRLLQLLSPEDLKEALMLLGYPEGSVGRLMTPDYVAVRKHWTIERALRHVRRNGALAETINRVFIIDDDTRLLDDVQLRRLFFAEPEALVESVMDYTCTSVLVSADQEEAVRLIRRYDQTALPVVDEHDVLLGIVTVDDLFDVAEEEATEDFHKHGATIPLSVSLKDASLFVLYRARIGWLMILVFMNIFSGAGIAYFEDTLASAISLAFFLPLLIDSGGNAGSQASTLMVRALATGDVRIKDWVGMLGKELGVAAVLGASMSAAVALVASVRAPEIVGVVALTMVLVVLVGSMVGMSLPFLLTRLRLDPATASAPLITSIADICGVLIYFSIASWYLGIG